MINTLVEFWLIRYFMEIIHPHEVAVENVSSEDPPFSNEDAESSQLYSFM